ncbi:DUF3592 domain-containing protein [Streptomyces justiciae]|uniref:DUF3592 domain-containing protein n=1 Tax=Streptomyces justiciae TaxID=2780140 RepID=UPI002117D1A5|nr:DUF3592 domain-containing protein [Streptomyces justiciae]MCW8383827.1 DUF3592 domain-containing protein [Streptomyces justiciae]
MGRGRVYTPQGAKRIRRALVLTLGLLVGLLFVTIGFILGLDNVVARVHFDDAEKVPAVVVNADYAKPRMKDSASFIRVKLPGVHNIQASIDNVIQAPDGLSPGDRVPVLYDPARPGHALFPSQLGWTKLMFPGGGFFLLGLGATIANGLAMVREIAMYVRS